MKTLASPVNKTISSSFLVGFSLAVHNFIGGNSTREFIFLALGWTRDGWLRWFGIPTKVVCDSMGKGVVASEMGEVRVAGV